MGRAPTPQNLIPVTERDPERAREIRAMGGKARGEKIRRSKNLREAFLAVQSLEIKGTDGTTKTASDAVAIAVMNKALKGDLKAIEFLWEALYGKQTKVDVTSSDGSMSPAKVDLSGLSREDLKAVTREALARRLQDGTA